MSFLSRIFLVTFTLSQLFFTPLWAQAYIAADWNIGFVMSDSDFNNGASAGSPGLALGFVAGRLSPEIFYKRMRFDQEEVIGGEGLVATDISSDVLGLGIRLNHHPLLYSKFGLSFHFVEAEYQALESSNQFESTIDKTWTAPYFGGGFKYPFNPRWELFTDIGFYLSGAEFSVFNWEFGLRFYSF